MSKVTPLGAAHHVAIAVHKTEKTKTRIKLKTTPQLLYGLDGARALASIKRRKKRQKHLRDLERLIAENAYPRKFFRPLEKYLIRKIRQGQIMPGLISFSVENYEKNC